MGGLARSRPARERPAQPIWIANGEFNQRALSPAQGRHTGRDAEYKRRLAMRYVISLIGTLLVFSGGLASYASPQAAVPLKQRSYVWYGQLMALDETTRTATVKAYIPAHVEKYVDQFKAGDRLVLVWDMVGKTEAQRALALWKQQDEKTSGNTGYVLPIEFVSADVPAHTVTFHLRVPATAMQPLRSVKAGNWIKVTTPMVQPSPDATIKSIEQASQPWALPPA